MNGFNLGFHIHCGPFWVVKGGYIVSVAGRSQTFTQEPTVEQLAEYLLKNWDVLKLPASILGGWLSEGIYHLDVNMLYLRRQAAIKRGMREGQLAIWDAKESKAIPLVSSSGVSFFV